MVGVTKDFSLRNRRRDAPHVSRAGREAGFAEKVMVGLATMRGLAMPASSRWSTPMPYGGSPGRSFWRRSRSFSRTKPHDAGLLPPGGDDRKAPVTACATRGAADPRPTRRVFRPVRPRDDRRTRQPLTDASTRTLACTGSVAGVRAGGHGDVRAAARAHDVLVSGKGVTAVPTSLPMLLTIDRPRHDVLRRQLVPHFTTARSAAMELGMREVIGPAIDRMLAARRRRGGRDWPCHFR